ncbi:MAG: DinB family protein, partial [Syntrophobacteraceae bacterium]
MDNQASQLAQELKSFNDEVADFVRACTEEDWGKTCEWEEWPVGVTARHIADGHYEAVGLGAMIIKGEKLPEMSMEAIVDGANQHAREHANCTKEEVLELLQNNGRKIIEFVAGLRDSELDREGHLAIMGGDISVRKLIDAVVLRSG